MTRGGIMHGRLVPMTQKTESWAPRMPDGRPAPYLMTKAEVAEFLRLDGSQLGVKLWRLRRNRGLRGLKVGRCVLYPLNEVLRFVHNEVERRPQ